MGTHGKRKLSYGSFYPVGLTMRPAGKATGGETDMSQWQGNETPIEGTYSGTGCFFCGKDNPAGAQLEFARVDGSDQELVSRWVPDKRFRGLGRVLHGGIQSGVFDEIMGWTAHHFCGRPGVTAELRVRYLGPLYIGEPLELRCRVAEADDKKMRLEARILNPEGKVCAEAKGVYVMMAEERFLALVGSRE